jgi:arabinose-5-phosphate isomerase
MAKTKNSIIQLAQSVLAIEAEEILNARSNINSSFELAVEKIFKCEGRVILSGMGKSGHIARKISSTFSSTGTPSFFMHPGEASHGDLGMILENDVVIFLSNSGNSDELISILPIIKRLGAYIIAITNNEKSPLSLESDLHINLNIKKEACPLGLAPTASTTVALALGDALSICVLELREFTADDFRKSHPAGNLGKNNFIKVGEIMRRGSDIPFVYESAKVIDAIREISKKMLGFTGVVDIDKKLIGMFTDGDLRRALLKNYSLDTPLSKIMTKNPKFLTESQLAVEALNKMEASKINSFLVTDKNNNLVGALNLQDLLKAKVI